MLTKTIIALSVAGALGTAMGALARPAHHPARPAVESQAPAGPAGSYAFEPAAGSSYAFEPGTNRTTVLGPSAAAASGTPQCWGGSCSPDWRADDGS